MPPVRYIVVSFIAAAIFGIGAGLMTIAVLELIEIGTCASGDQAFAVARECPEGTGTIILWAMAGGFALVAAVFIWLVRGPRFHIPGKPPVIGADEGSESFRPGFVGTRLRYNRDEVDDPGPWFGIATLVLGLAIGLALGLALGDATIPRT